MIYPSDFESKIGFDSLRGEISAKCISTLGRQQVSAMKFSADYNLVNSALQCVKEMMEVMRLQLPLPLSNLHDITPYLNEIRSEGSFTSAANLHKIKGTLKLMTEVADFFSKQKDEETGQADFPYLDAELGNILQFKLLFSTIDRCINKFGEVKDNASPELSEIRSKMRMASGSVQRAVKRAIDKAVAEGIVEKDTTASIRDGRMVIPVSNSNKRGISGIIHDESATGKTVYIEPSEVVEASNRLRELEMEERREIINILRAIALEIRPFISEIKESCAILGKMDFIRAKALFATEMNAQMPHLSPKPEIEWYHAVHPGLLLSLRAQGREVVPLNLTLSHSQRILIISGPNAGGKSICLKTTAIVQYMMQCGVMPTLYANSHAGIFKSIFIDIGDEQSLENDLSTYSSHLKNMKYFLAHADSQTIILADEMGSGTEPLIGGAIAQAILTQLGQADCYGIVTTHYQNLKTFADATPGFVNGAMLYDRQHLQPTFELSIGTAGSSFAIDIASKIGLPKNVIENAKTIAGSEYVNIDKYLSEITRDRRYWANKRLSIKEKEAKLDGLVEKYESTSEQLRDKRKEIINEAKREAKDILANVNSTIERTILEIRRTEAEKETTKKLRKNVENLKLEIEKEIPSSKVIPKLPENIKPKNKKPHNSPQKEIRKPEPKQLQAGDYVKLKDGNTVGKILSLSGKKAEVVFGSLRTHIDISRLLHSQPPKESALSGQTSISNATTEQSRKRQLGFKNEIDVRGMRADEAIQAVTYFLDDAIQFSIDRVRILHGTGHGILKTLIRQQLQSNTAVESFHDEDIRFGGAGITVVNLA